jgi:4-hydroxybenzoate polyprenyltransferase
MGRICSIATYDRPMPAALRLIHPAPTAAVVALSAAIAIILSLQASLPIGWRVALTVLSVAGSQVATGAFNDWADRARDADARPEKPIPAGDLSPNAALAIGVGGAVLQLASSAALGALPLVLGAIALGSALAYDLWLSRTPLSVVPYLVSFGVLPAWIAAGIGVPLERVAGASLLVAPFAASAHLANTARDFEADAVGGSRSLAQLLGRKRSHAVALALALGVGVGVGAALAVGGRLTPMSAALGGIGLLAVALGAAGPRRLWYGLLVAAVAWASAWALATA